ncbi:hypothetical protein E4656_07875 [Natronospirillum operosum]|uniref:Alginate export domain-containing protein n=1 Tax=Natronospirillum operosum TaxID=2759953 RepID=A0A4Z0WFK8_9GAMM|nr:hypothetical protein [Natronospirillum operosum]TGG94086.1 hypothetical protein E4656_07875 [Natronospirillum operosum]
MKAWTGPALAGLLLASVAVAADTDVWIDLNLGVETQMERTEPLTDPALTQTAGSRFNLLHHVDADVRLNLQYGLEQRLHVRRGSGLGGPGLASGAPGADYRWEDLTSNLYSSPDDDLVLTQNLDRANVQYFGTRGELSAGRQAISLGLSPQFSPMDVIMPARISAQERSYRPGVDALRWRQPWGAFGELDLGWVQGSDQALFVRAYQQVDRWTLEATALTVNRSEHLLGVGAQTAVGDWGLWQESAWLFNEDDSGLRLTLGADRQIFGDVYVVGEYHYNQLGARRPDMTVLASDFYQQGLVVPWGRHYAGVQASAPVSALTDLQAGTVINLGDESALLTTGFQHSLTNDSRLEGTLGVPVATRSEASASEFGLYPLTAALNWSATF